MTNTHPDSRGARHLVLIDIENIVATPSPTVGQVASALRGLAQVVPGFDSAQRVWGCSHRAALTVGCTAPRDRHLWRSGHNGADLALLEVLDGEQVDKRFGRVTVCSGDGIFADSVARLAGSGVTVGVVSLRDHLAARLRMAAHRFAFLPETADALGTAS